MKIQTHLSFGQLAKALALHDTPSRNAPRKLFLRKITEDISQNLNFFFAKHETYHD